MEKENMSISLSELFRSTIASDKIEIRNFLTERYVS